MTNFLPIKWYDGKTGAMSFNILWVFSIILKICIDDDRIMDICAKCAKIFLYITIIICDDDMRLPWGDLKKLNWLLWQSIKSWFLIKLFWSFVNEKSITWFEYSYKSKQLWEYLRNSSPKFSDKSCIVMMLCYNSWGGTIVAWSWNFHLQLDSSRATIPAFYTENKI